MITCFAREPFLLYPFMAAVDVASFAAEQGTRKKAIAK
jgi:hypothetical protein